MVKLSLMRRHLCSPGIFAIIVISLLPLLQWHCCCLQAGVVALVTMASLPLLMRGHLCHCYDGVITLLALAPLPTLHRHCCPHCAGVVVLIALTSLPSLCMGVVTVIAPVLISSSTWHVCAIAMVLSALSLSVRWYYHPLCAASLPCLFGLVVFASCS
jgi:hypothetical protein